MRAKGVVAAPLAGEPRDAIVSVGGGVVPPPPTARARGRVRRHDDVGHARGADDERPAAVGRAVALIDPDAWPADLVPVAVQVSPTRVPPLADPLHWVIAAPLVVAGNGIAARVDAAARTDALVHGLGRDCDG